MSSIDRYRRRPSKAQRERLWRSVASAAKELAYLEHQLEYCLRRDGPEDHTPNGGWPTVRGSEWESPVEEAVLARLEADRPQTDPVRHHASGACDSLVAVVDALADLRFHLTAVELLRAER